MLFLLRMLWGLCCGGKCLSIKLFSDVVILKGKLNQTILHFLYFFFGCASLNIKSFLYGGITFLKLSKLQESSDSRFDIFGSGFVTEG